MSNSRESSQTNSDSWTSRSADRGLRLCRTLFYYILFIRIIRHRLPIMELCKCISKHVIRRNKFSQLRGLATTISRNIEAKTANFDNVEDREKTTHFGFKTIKESEKEKEVRTVFENVADSYDVMNDAMSLGIHRIWKDIFVQELGPTHGSRLLDAAGGTGDITFRYLSYLNKLANPKGIKSHVTVSDINQNMLDVGKVRAQRQGLTRENGYDISWLQGDAEKLPCPDESFTAYTIAFGIRNVTHIDKVLEDAYRVLQPGGRFMCLEFSHLNNETLQWAYDKYSFQMIPVLGSLIAGQWEPYQYLVESIRKFPKQEDFKDMIEGAGFRQVSYKNLTFGVVAIHSGFKI